MDNWICVILALLLATLTPSCGRIATNVDKEAAAMSEEHEAAEQKAKKNKKKKKKNRGSGNSHADRTEAE